MSGKASLTIVIPAYNEAENLPELLKRLEALVPRMGRPCNVLFVEDGSQDDTFAILEQASRRLPWLGVLKFSRNFGQQVGLAAGFRHADGEIVAMIDADLQLDPEEIPRLVAKIDEGYDGVLGCRTSRPESFWLRRLPSRIANWAFERFAHVPTTDIGSGLRVFRKALFEGLDPQSPIFVHSVLYASWRGARFAEVPISFHARKHGESKYSFVDLGHLLLDLMITFSSEPIFLLASFLFGGVTIGLGLLTLLIWLIRGIAGAGLSAATGMLGFFMILTGLFAIMLGFQNERMARITRRLDGTPTYVVDRFLEPRAFAGTEDE
jgi:glycosyltransferase involved in cell wall biosynthesis